MIDLGAKNFLLFFDSIDGRDLLGFRFRIGFLTKARGIGDSEDGEDVKELHDNASRLIDVM